MKFLSAIRPWAGAAPAVSPPGSLAAAPAGKLGYLAATDIFQDLTPAELTEIDRMTAITTCRRGRVFYTPGETGEVLFVLKKGRVNIYRLSLDGHKLVTGTVEAGTIFGEMALIGQGMGGSFAEAAEDCTFCLMGQADLERLITHSPKVALRLIEVLAARLETAQEQLETLAFRAVPARLASALLRLRGADTDEFVGVTHQELADLIGVHRETVTRVLNDFGSRGLIELHRSRIRLRSADGLRALADE